MFYFFDLPFFQNLWDAHDLKLVSLPARLVNKRVLGDQLVIVFIGRHHPSLKTGRFGFPSQRADHIVRFVTRIPENGDVQSVQHSSDQRDLFADIFWLFVAGRFVFGKLFVAKGRFLGVECHGNVCGLLPFENIEQRIRDAVHSRSGLSCRSKPRTTDHAKMSPIYKRHPIEQIQFFRVLLRKQIALSGRFLFSHASGSDLEV